MRLGWNRPNTALSAFASLCRAPLEPQRSTTSTTSRFTLLAFCLMAAAAAARAAACCLLLLSLAAAAAPPPPPNFLILFPDQWRADWTPLAAGLPLRMPTLAALSSRATRFTHAYVPSPLCAPSRACLAGGRAYDAAGVPDNFSNDYPLNHTTFYALLKRANYTVMTAGKDDLTKATGPSLSGDFHAAALGFSQWARCDGKSDAAGASPHDPYGAFCAAHYEQVAGRNESFWDIYNSDMRSCAAPPGAGSGYDCRVPSPLPQGAYEDDWVAANALALLRAKPAGAPWLLQVSFPGPHPPVVVTGAMKNATAGRAFPLALDNPTLDPAVQQTVRADYAAELENLDGLFSRLLAAVPPEEAPRTYVIVASDHGEELGDHGNWGKTLPWQGSVAVPLLVAGPGVPAGAVVATPVGTMDIAGTVLDLAGVAPDAANGMTTRSLRPLLAPAPNASAYRDHVASGLGAWRAVVMARPSGRRLKLVCCRGASCPGQPRNATAPRAYGGGSGEPEGVYPRSLLGGGGAPAPAAPAAPAGSAAAAWTLLLFDVDAAAPDMDDLAPSSPESVKDMRERLPQGWCPA